jgi:hypothetical protein
MVALALAPCDGPSASPTVTSSTATPSTATAVPRSGSASVPAGTPAVANAPPAGGPADRLASDLLRRTDSARSTFSGPSAASGPLPLRTLAGTFVLLAPDRGSLFAPTLAAADRLLAALLVSPPGGPYFTTVPVEAVTVYVFSTTPAFAAFCRARVPGRCDADTPFGLYHPSTREIFIDASRGVHTLDHEILHPLMQADFPLAPRWLCEGFAALFENPVYDAAGAVHGAKHWRLERDLYPALLSPAKRAETRLDALFAMDDDAFRTGDVNLHYAVARYLLEWLDSKHLLWPFYEGWRDAVLDDRSGENTFLALVGETPPAAQGEWEAWLHHCHSPVVACAP